MTVRYIGGGHKRMYRHVAFKRVKDGVAANVKTIEYDPNRTARIALVVYADGEKSYKMCIRDSYGGSTGAQDFDFYEKPCPLLPQARR